MTTTSTKWRASHVSSLTTPLSMTPLPMVLTKDTAWPRMRFSAPAANCVTSVVIIDDVIVAGFSSGHLRLYSIAKEALLAEIVAHAKCVTALSSLRSRVSPLLYESHHAFLSNECRFSLLKVVSTGKDSFVNVWAIPSFSKESEEVWSPAQRNLCNRPAWTVTRSSSHSGSRLQVELLFSKNSVDQLITGATFLKNGDLVTNAYDVDALSVFSLL